MKHEIEFLNAENSKTNELHKLVLNLLQRLDLKSSNKHVVLQNLSIYCTSQNIIRKQYKSNKLKIIAPIWNDEFELPDVSYSASDIQDCIEYIIKKYKILTAIPPIHVYINRINNRLVFKIKNGYKLQLQTPETMKLFSSRKNCKTKQKIRENVPGLDVVEVVLVQCNLVYNQYQQKSEVLYTFTPNTSNAYLLNVEPSDLVFLKSYNTEFDQIIITFTNQNGRPLEIEEKVNLTLYINK